MGRVGLARAWVDDVWAACFEFVVTYVGFWVSLCAWTDILACSFVEGNYVRVYSCLRVPILTPSRTFRSLQPPT